MKVINLFFILFLVNISLIYSQQTKYEIPISICPEKHLPAIDVLIGEETTTNPFFLDIEQEKSWIHIKNEGAQEKKDLPTIKYDMFSISGEDKKGHCYLSNKEKSKILKIDNFEYLEVPKTTGEETFLNSIALNNIITNTEALKNEKQDKNFGFNIDFPSLKLNIGKFDDNEKANLKKLELKDNKWKFDLSAVLFDDINLNDKSGELFKITNKTNGLKINRDIELETVYAPFYVSKDFFDYIEDSNYFIHEKEKLCERKIVQGNIIYLCDKTKKDKIKNINLVLNNKYVLPLTKDHLLTCQENSNTCEFNIKFNPKVNKFVLGVEILKNLNIYFMKNENSVYLKGIDILECDLSEATLNIIGKKDKMKALFQLVQTFTVVVSIFIFLFIIFYLHSKCRGHLYEEKDKKDEEELVDIEDKEKN